MIKFEQQTLFQNLQNPFFSDNDWRQQRLDAWQPILTASTVLPSFAVIGMIFIPVGIALLKTSDSIQELSYDYTNCQKNREEICPPPVGKPCYCDIHFELKEGR
jgi:hypothetical protein